MGLTYLDSCVVLDAVVSPSLRGDRARSAIASIESDALVVSPLVDLECMVRPLRTGDQQRITFMRQALARFRPVQITARAYELAAHMRAIHGIKTIDALHVATASLAGCSKVWTSDEALLRALPGFAVEPADQV